MPAEPKHLDDLFLVGPQKPMGYLPLHTITGICQQELHTVGEHSLNQGNACKLFLEEECQVFSGALYVWNPTAITQLLKREAATVRRFHLPTHPAAFVQLVASTHFDQPAVQRLIGLAFADPRWT